MREPKFYRRFDYPKTLLPNAYLASLEEGVTTIDEARARTGATIGYPGWLVIYSLLLSSLKPGQHHVLVETGTNVGASTIMLAQALTDAGVDGVIHTFEIDDETQRIAKANIEAAGHAERVNFHLGDTRRVFGRTLTSLNTSISGAFLDGGHEETVLLNEFEVVRPYLGRGALVFIDNTYPIAEVEKGEDRRVNEALRSILASYGGSLINLPFVSWFTPGLAIWQADPPLEISDWE
jgi:predicted O-methyltransferase YrrM